MAFGKGTGTFGFFQPGNREVRLEGAFFAFEADALARVFGDGGEIRERLVVAGHAEPENPSFARRGKDAGAGDRDVEWSRGGGDGLAEMFIQRFDPIFFEAADEAQRKVKLFRPLPPDAQVGKFILQFVDVGGGRSASLLADVDGDEDAFHIGFATVRGRLLKLPTNMRVVKIASALIVAAILIIGGFVYWIYSSLNAPHNHDKSEQYIKIEKGTSPAQIISMLAANNIIPSETPTWLYLRFAGDASKLQAGEYQFESPITPLQVLKELERGESRMIRLTIPEGFTRFDIAKRLIERFPFQPAVTESEILSLMNDTSLIKDIAPQARNLEGYMYPSTYSLPREARPADVVKVMVEQFRKVWKPEWTEAARHRGRTPHEIVTIASLIETESGVESERPIVSSVIYNRLNRGMALGIDQTAVYIAKMENRWDGTIHRSDLESDSPYNTRKFAGLPPGPISSVSESAITAALNPAQTDYIFYVLNVDANDGSHWFYATAAEFERGKAKYQEWLEQQREEMRQAASNR